MSSKFSVNFSNILEFEIKNLSFILKKSANLKKKFQNWNKLCNFERKLTNSIENLIIFSQNLKPLFKFFFVEFANFYEI